MKLWKYNIKLVHSVYKDIVCLLYVLILNMSIYIGTCLDYINECNMYFSLIGILLFSDILLVDKNYNTSEILHLVLTRKKHSVNLLERYVVILVQIVVLFCLSWGIFLIRIHLTGIDISGEPIGFGTYLITTIMSITLLGTLAFTCSNIVKNKLIGYIFALAYWIFWMTHPKTETVFNLFPFVRDPADYMKYIVWQLVIVIVLFLTNIWFWNEKWISKNVVLRKVK